MLASVVTVGFHPTYKLFYDIDTLKDGSLRANRLLPNPPLSDASNNIINDVAKISIPSKNSRLGETQH